jgi:hypothetical protein
VAGFCTVPSGGTKEIKIKVVSTYLDNFDYVRLDAITPPDGYQIKTTLP